MEDLCAKCKGKGLCGGSPAGFCHSLTPWELENYISQDLAHLKYLLGIQLSFPQVNTGILFSGRIWRHGGVEHARDMALKKLFNRTDYTGEKQNDICAI